MANKYVDVSATYNGDGTSSVQATSDGAVGAWNDFAGAWNGLPAYGSLSAGDIVNIRTHDGTNSLGHTATATMSNTTTLPAIGNVLKYVFDNGTIWGDAGVFYLYASSQIIAIQNYIHCIGNNCFKMELTQGTYDNKYIGFYNCYVSGVEIVINGSPYYRTLYLYESTRFELCVFTINPSGSSGKYLCERSSENNALFVGCTFDIPNYNKTYGLFQGREAGSMTFVGGGFTDAVQDTIYFAFVVGRMFFDRFDFKNTQKELSNQPSTPNPISDLMVINSFAGEYDFIYKNNFGVCDFDSSGNYPYLNALLPDGSPWSYKITPANYNQGASWKLPTMHKKYTSTSAAKTLTINALISELITPTSADFWVAFQYENTSGEVKTISSSYNTAALSASTAGWSSNFYADKNYDKYKIELTTADQIKQNTIISATIFLAIPPVGLDDFYFIDPEIGVS